MLNGCGPTWKKMELDLIARTCRGVRLRNDDGPPIRDLANGSGRRDALSDKLLGGQGRDRTVDLPLFRRTLVPTELPGRKAPVPRKTQVPRQTGDPDGT